MDGYLSIFNIAIKIMVKSNGIILLLTQHVALVSTLSCYPPPKKKQKIVLCCPVAFVLLNKPIIQIFSSSFYYFSIDEIFFDCH